MRRCLCCLLALFLLLPLCACGKERPAPTASPTPAAAPAASASTALPRKAFDNSGVKLQGTALGSLSCDTPYRTVFSDVWEVPEGESAVRRFYLYTDGLALWNNFLVILKSTAEEPEGEAGNDEYATVRADHYGTGAGFKNAVSESDWNWDSFCSDVNGALMELTVSNKGKTAEVSITATAADETVYHQTYKDIATDGPLFFCLSVENACLDLLEAETE